VVYRQVSDPRAWAGSGLRQLRVRSYYRFVDGVLSLSDATAATLVSSFGVRPEGITLVPNAIDARSWPAGDDGRAARARLGLPVHPHPVVAAVGALAPEKRLDLLVDAVARLQVVPTLVLAGDGPERAALTAQAARVGVDLRLLGSLEDPTDTYLAADVVALASATEAQPAVLLEAGACERPVVATAVGGVPAMVEDGTTGRLVPSGDVAALAAALGDLLADPSGRRAAGVAARARVLATADLAAVAPLVAAALARAAT
jgi:glycosyltransferase involved in cell wall biosynthesis